MTRHRACRRVVRVVVAVVTVALVSTVSAPVAGAQEGSSCYLVRGVDTPDDATDDVEVCRLDTWIHQPDAPVAPVGNLAGAGVQGFPSWNTQPPTGSLSGGAYLLQQRLGPVDDRHPPGATFEGSYDGPLDNFGVTFYVLRPEATPVGTPVTVTYHVALVSLEVDGEELYSWMEGGPGFFPSPVGIHKISFAFRNIYDRLEQLGLEREGTHDISINVTPAFINGNNAVYLYDAVEVPSSISFNLTRQELFSHQWLFDVPLEEETPQ